MNRVSVVFILNTQDLSVSVDDVLRILLKEIENADVEFFVALDGVGVMEDLT